ncbi:MAG: hypothetical protein SWZ49_29990 [Cyanobacteriota bacterium]|nr:hypothetical protein [Cyanobacteriota bacterium]
MRKSFLAYVYLFFGFVLFSPLPAAAATIKLYFDAFIPEKRAVNSAADVLPPFYTSFIGDARDFDLNATIDGQSRLFTQVTLDTAAENPLIDTFTNTSVTIGFREENGVEVADELKSVPTSNVTANRVDNSIVLHVFAEARNPLIEQNLPPDIDTPPASYDYQIILTQTENLIDYTLTGSTRAYPAYSVFIEDTPILLNPAGETSDLLFVTEPIRQRQGQITQTPESIPEPPSVIGFLILALSRDTCKIMPHRPLTLTSHSFYTSLPSNLLHVSL